MCLPIQIFAEPGVWRQFLIVQMLPTETIGLLNMRPNSWSLLAHWPVAFRFTIYKKEWVVVAAGRANPYAALAAICSGLLEGLQASSPRGLIPA